MIKPKHIFFNSAEAAVLGMGLATLITDLNEMKKPEYIDVPWTPEARKAQKEMVETAQSAASKLEKFAGIKCNLPPYNPGDENEFFTKQS